ncbi:MAG: hypothetical protein OXB93_04875 [Cytophagales bacterium]|nr:hypothetical protein [Cytophagales bacterium]
MSDVNTKKRTPLGEAYDTDQVFRDQVNRYAFLCGAECANLGIALVDPKDGGAPWLDPNGEYLFKGLYEDDEEVKKIVDEIMQPDQISYYWAYVDARGDLEGYIDKGAWAALNYLREDFRREFLKGYKSTSDGE